MSGPRSYVELHEIEQQRSLGWPDFHPEDYCHKCGVDFESWYTDRETWLTATAAWAAETGREGICCISCFVQMYEIATGHGNWQWRLTVEKP